MVRMSAGTTGALLSLLSLQLAKDEVGCSTTNENCVTGWCKANTCTVRSPACMPTYQRMPMLQSDALPYNCICLNKQAS